MQEQETGREQPVAVKKFYKMKSFNTERMRAWLQELYSQGYRAVHISEFFMWYVIGFAKQEPFLCAVTAEELPRGEEKDIIARRRNEGFRPALVLDGIAFFYKEGEAGTDAHKAGPSARHPQSRMQTGLLFLAVMVLALLLLSRLYAQSLWVNCVLLFIVCVLVGTFSEFLLPLATRDTRSDAVDWLMGRKKRNAKGNTPFTAAFHVLLYSAVAAGVVFLIYTLTSLGSK